MVRLAQGRRGGKLIAVARHIGEPRARPLPVDVDDLAAWGVDPSSVPSAPEPEPLVVWPRNRTAVRVYLASATQWRWVSVGMGAPVRTGLDYAAVEAVMRMQQVPRCERADCLARLAVLENETIAIDTEHRRRG